MIKKYSKLILLVAILFTVSITNVSAKQLKLADLGKEIEKVNPNADYAYIIGEYVFTGRHTLTTQDIMLGARSIGDITEADGHVGPDTANKITAQSIYGKMAIQEIKKECDEYFENCSWKVNTNKTGATTIDENTDLDIKYIDYAWVKEDTKVNLDFDVSNEKYKDTYTKVLKDDLGFEASQAYSKGKIGLVDGKLTGLILKDTNITLDPSDITKYNNPVYFFAYILEVEEANAKTTININNPINGNSTVGFDKFDVTEDGTPGIVVLVPLQPGKAESDADKIITITIDRDGEDGIYGETVQTIDWSGLTFQETSKAKISEKIPEADSEYMKEHWGYVLPTGDEKHYTFNQEGESNTFKLGGTIEEQHINANVFSESAEDGYYFLININKPDGMTEIPGNAVIKVKGENEKLFKGSDLDENGLSVLVKLNDDCKKDSKCKFTVEIDWDGEGNDNYLPVTYTIDYSGVTFEKTSIINVKAIESSEVSGNEWKNWSPKDGYQTEFSDIDGEHVINVTGFIPMFTFSENPITSSYDYYLGLKIQKAGTEDDSSSTKNVKFLTGEGSGETNEIKSEDFNNGNTIYLLKWVNPNKSGTTKKFTITVDFDDEGKEYAPYTVTIDWSGLEFQKESLGSDFDLVSTDAGLNEKDKADLESFGYNYEANSLTTENNTDEEGNVSGKKITGVIREQELTEAAGYTEAKGYYVPIKIEFPEGLDSKYQDELTVTLYSKDGKTRVVKPTEEDFKQGFIVALYQISKDAQEIKYSIDYDGDGKEYIADEVKIKLDTIDYREMNEVTFTYLDENGAPTTKVIPAYDKEKINQDLVPTIDYAVPYHTFDYWTEAGEEFDFEAETFGTNDDRILTAHWTVDSDKFIADVIKDLDDGKTDYSNDFSDKFDVTKDGNTITFDVKDATFTLEEMDNTSIPGAIAYILQKGEIKEIKLGAKNKEVVFTKDGANNIVISKTALDEEGNTLKGKIQAGAKALFSDTEVYGQDAGKKTLNDMAAGNEKFTLTIGDIDSSIKLTDGATTEYTFEFTTETVSVIDETGLENALQNPNVKYININGDFEVKKSQTIDREVEINGTSDSKHTITADNLDTIFTVKSNNVTIKNVKLAEAKKKAINVESGSLTVSGVEITYADSLQDTFEAGIEVGDNATLTASDMTFDKETYEHPLVRTSKTRKAKINLTDNKSKLATQVEKEKITKYEDKTEGNGDKKETDSAYTYYNYYCKEENSKIYTTVFYNYEGRRMAEFIRYSYYGDSVKPSHEAPFTVFNSIDYDGYKYTLIGFTESRNNTLHDTAEPLPKDVIKEEEIKATADKHYYAAYKMEIETSTRRVDSQEELIAALKDEGVSYIYITNENDELDITSEENIEISRALTISGTPRMAKIKLNNIKVTADNVFLSRLKLNFTNSSSVESLIEVTDNAKDFSVWQCNITNSGTSAKNAIKYKGIDEAIADIRWTTFSADNISETYINIDSALAAGTEIYGNTFNKISAEGKTSAIIIKKFANDNDFSDTEEANIRIGANTVKTDYILKLSEEASGTKAIVSLETSSNVTMAVKYTDDKNQFDKIQFYANPTKVTAKYLDSNNQESDTPGESGSKVKIVVKTVMES